MCSSFSESKLDVGTNAHVASDMDSTAETAELTLSVNHERSQASKNYQDIQDILHNAGEEIEESAKTHDDQLKVGCFPSFTFSGMNGLVGACLLCREVPFTIHPALIGYFVAALGVRSSKERNLPHNLIYHQ